MESTGGAGFDAQDSAPGRTSIATVYIATALRYRLASGRQRPAWQLIQCHDGFRRDVHRFEKVYRMPSSRTDRKRHAVACSTFLFLIALLSIAAEARADAGLIKGVKEFVEAAAKNADLARHADRFSQISARFSGEAHFITKSGGKLEIQSWLGGKAIDIATFSPENFDDVLQAAGNFKLFVAEDNLYDLESAILKASEGTALDLHVILDDGETLPLAVRRLEGGSSLAIKKSENLSYSLKGWSKRSLLKRSVMPDLAARMRVIVMAPETDTLLREAFRNRLGKRVFFVDSERALRDELKTLDRQLVILVGHVEGMDFLLKVPPGDLRIQVPIADVHAAIDDSQSIGLLLGCKVGCKTAFTGPDVDINALDVATGIRSGISQRTPEEFLETLGNQIGLLHVDEDISGRLQAVSYQSIRREDRAIAGTTAAAGITATVSKSNKMSRRVLLPRELPFFYSPSLFVGFYSFIFIFGWPILVAIYLFTGDSISEVISSVWDIYWYISPNSISDLPRRLDQKFFVVFFGPHLIFLSLCVAVCAIPFLILMRIASWARSAPYPSDVSYRIRWLPFYVVFLIARLIRTLLQKLGVLHAGNPEPSTAV